MMTAADLAARYSAKRSGKEWLVSCPAHPDRDPSLNFKDGDKGVVFKCRSRDCSAESILSAWNLTFADVMIDTCRTDTPRTHTPFVYTERDGTPLRQSVRVTPGFDGKRKSHYVQHPDGRGGWVKGLGNARRVPYRLNELQGQHTVFAPEGEPHCDKLFELGLPATCNLGGAGKWTAAETAALVHAGVKAIITLPDNDDPGHAHGQLVARINHAAGLAVKVVNLPGLAPKGDILDWLAAGHTRAELEQLVAQTPLWTPTPTTDDRFTLTGIGDLLSEPDDAHDWLVHERLACGSVNLLAGRPKGGKSTLARALALAVARGERWLGHHCHPGRVVYIALEDKRSEVKRHLRGMGATGDEPIRFLIGSAPHDLLARLTAMIAAGDTIDLLIIDTAQRLLQVKDSNDYAVVTAAFEPVLALARTHQTCIVLLHHAGKADRAGIEAVMGSTAWAASVDNVLILNRKERYRLLSTIQRIGPDLDETVVLMDEATGEVRFGGSRYLVDLEHVAAAVLSLVQDAGAEGLGQSAALADVEARRDLKLKALRLLMEHGSLTRTGKGHRYDPYVLHVAPREPDDRKRKNADGMSSGSEVPSRDWEPDEKNTQEEETLRNSGDSSGSRDRAGSHGSENPAEDITDGYF